MNENIAILHDKFTELGGAEHVAIEMARTFDAPIYTAIKDDDLIPDDVDTRPAFTRWWEHRLMDSHYLVQDAVQMLAWQHVPELHEYDTIILNKNNPGWYVPRDHQTVIKYCHSTPRQPYDLFHTSGESYLRRALMLPMRVLYRPNITYPDAWATNSDLVHHRLQKYWGLAEEDVNVIYPPVHTHEYSPNAAPTQDYFFTLGRLVEHKRTHDIVEAFNQLGPDYPLLVAGSGPERDKLEDMAADHIEFLGYIDEEEKRRRLSEARAFMFAAENEDFGMTVPEAFASGTPVIGVRDGYTQHQVIDGKNGYTYPREGGHLREKVRHFDRNPVQWRPEKIAEFAEQFSASRFRDELREFVETAQAETAISVPWDNDATAEQVDDTVEAAADGGVKE